VKQCLYFRVLFSYIVHVFICCFVIVFLNVDVRLTALLHFWNVILYCMLIGFFQVLGCIPLNMVIFMLGFCFGIAFFFKFGC